MLLNIRRCAQEEECFIFLPPEWRILWSSSRQKSNNIVDGKLVGAKSFDELRSITVALLSGS